MSPPEHFELIDQIVRCRDLLALMRDPGARKTIADLIAYLEAKLTATDGRLANRA